MSAFDDIGIDFGTSNTVIVTEQKGIVLNEPSFAALDNEKGRIIAVGKRAYSMTGKTPKRLTLLKLMCRGRISDPETARAILKVFLQKAVGGRHIINPRVSIFVQVSATDVEKKSMADTAFCAGARKVFLVEHPLAALIGFGAGVISPEGKMVVDIGGGTTDIAVVSLGGTVIRKSVKCAGNDITESIIKAIASKYKLLVGELTAERIKIELASLSEPGDEIKEEIKGKDLISGMPRRVIITQNSIYKAVCEKAVEIVLAVREVLEKTPPELISDIHTNGIFLSGGGSLLKGLDRLIEKSLGVKAVISSNPFECTAEGALKAVKMSDMLKDGFEQVSSQKH